MTAEKTTGIQDGDTRTIEAVIVCRQSIHEGKGILAELFGG
jgi:hypothetical protein